MELLELPELLGTRESVTQEQSVYLERLE